MEWQGPTGRETSGLCRGECPAVILVGTWLVRRVSRQGSMGRMAQREPEVRGEPEETQEPEVREMRKTGFQGRELSEQKLRVSQESLESGGGSIRQSRDFDLR